METVVSGQLSVVSWKKSRSLGPLVMTIPKLSSPAYRQKKAVERGTQRAAHEGVGGFVGFLFAEFGDLGGEGEPEAFLHAYGIVVPALRRAARVVERGTRRLSVGRKAGPSVRS